MRGLLKGVLALCVLCAAATFGLFLFWFLVVSVALPNLENHLALFVAQTIEASGGLTAQTGLPVVTGLAAALAAFLCASDDRIMASALLGVAAALQFGVVLISLLVLNTDGANDWGSFLTTSLQQSLIMILLSLISLGLVCYGLWSAARSHFLRDL